MKINYRYFLALSFYLFVGKHANAQVGSNSLAFHIGLESIAYDYLWSRQGLGQYLGLEYNRRLPYRFEVGVGLSHHFMANGATGSIHNDGFKYLMILKDKSYQYLTEDDVKHLANHGVKRLPDQLNKINSFKMEVGISYDFLKTIKHDLQIVASGNLNMTSATWHTDNWAGIFVSPGLPIDTVRYIVPYEQRSFGFGSSFSIRYRHIRKNGVFFGGQISRNYLITINGGSFHSIGLFIGKRFNKK